MYGRALMIAAAAACTTLSACATEPMATQAGEAAFSGYTYGSGNSSAGAATATVSSTVAGDSSAGAGRGGYTYGSGN